MNPRHQFDTPVSVKQRGSHPPKNTQRYGVRGELKVMPTQPQVNSPAVNTVFPRQRASRFACAVTAARLNLSRVVVLPNMVDGRQRITSLISHVVKVVLFSSQKQMIRINARRVVAAVKYAKAGRDWAVMDFPRDAVRFNALVPYANCAVACRFRSGSPSPTRAKFRAHGWPVLVNFIPEAICKWYFRFSQDRNLHRQVSFWSGSADRSSGLSSCLYFNTQRMA